LRFADGARRPAYNAQIAVAPREGVILAVAMTDRRNDAGLAAPMVDEIVERYGRAPQNLLVDTHYASAEDIAVLAAHEAGPVKVFAPPPTEREDVKPETLKRRVRLRAREPESVKAWRRRMATPEGQAVFSRRKSIERINGNLKNHGFGFMPVRGPDQGQSHRAVARPRPQLRDDPAVAHQGRLRRLSKPQRSREQRRRS